MELYALPVEPTGRPQRLRAARHAAYDGLPFLSYPSRQGVPWLEKFPIGDINVQKFTAEYGNSKIEETSLLTIFPLLQTWLYYGLLAEAFATSCAISSEEPAFTAEVEAATQWATPWVYAQFTTEDGYLSTAKFFDLTARHWLNTLVNEPFPLVKKKYDHLHKILDRSTKALTLFMSKSLIQAEETWHRAHLIAPTEGLVCLMQKIDTRLESKFQKGVGIGGQIPFPDHDLMLRNGWCANDIQHVAFRYDGWHNQLFLNYVKLPMPFLGRTHDKCTAESCLVSQSPNDKFKLRHVSGVCSGDCGWIGPDPEMIRQIVMKEGCLPILEISATSMRDIDIKVVEWPQDNVKFISISHVWNQGLGNASQNALFKCQIFQLLEYISSIGAEDEGVPLNLVWLDTFCCPVVPEDASDLDRKKWTDAKTKAIEKLPLVYKSASTALILDHGLKQFQLQEWLLYRGPLETLWDEEPMHRVWELASSETVDFNIMASHVVETVFRVMTCGWARRLWTYQEVALSRDAFFIFHNGAVSRTALTHWLSCIRLKTFAWNSIVNHLMRDMMSYTTFDYGPSGHHPLAVLNKSLAFRGVTVPSDEPLCLTTLMGLDLGEVASITLESKELIELPKTVSSLQSARMKKFWELTAKTHGVPYSFILQASDVPMIHKWAPLSILSPSKTLHYHRRCAFWHENLGLDMQTGGFILKPKPLRAAGIVNHGPYWQKALPIPETQLIFRHASSNRWYRITNLEVLGQERPLQQLVRESRFALVVDNTDSHACVVIRCDTKDGFDASGKGYIKGEIKYRCVLFELSQEDSHFNARMHEMASALQADEDVAKLPETPKLPNDPGWRTLVTSVIGKSKAIMSEMLEKDPAFQKVMAETYYPQCMGAEDGVLWIWIHSYQGCDAEELPSDQVWYVN